MSIRNKVGKSNVVPEMSKYDFIAMEVPKNDQKHNGDYQRSRRRAGRRDGRRFYRRADDEEFQTDEEESRQGNACCRRSV